MAIEMSKRQPCPACQENGLDTAGDNLAVYADGKYCQSCGYKEKLAPMENKIKTMSALIPGTVVELRDRKLSLSTCEKYNVRTKSYTGKLGGGDLVEHLVTIFPLYVDGKVARQKIRSKSEKSIMAQRGNMECKKLFGQQAFSPTKKLPVIVTEGEYDAMAAYQMSGLPAVSILNGAQGASKDILNNMEWLSGWREVLLCFDMDEPGRNAVTTCLNILEPGSTRNIILPEKDANEMLLEGRVDDFKKCLSAAEVIKPTTIVFPEEIIEDIVKPPAYGSNWPWKFMTKVTYGNRLGEVYMLAGDTSVGKTQITYEIVCQHLQNGCKVGLIDLERQTAQTMQRIIGCMHNQVLHVPSSEKYPEEMIRKEVAKMKESIALYRPESGKLTIESVLVNIRYLNKAYGMTFFVLDNLTALSVNMGAGVKEHEYASMVTGQLVQIAKELNVTIFIINHLIKAPVQLNADITMGDDFVYKTNKEGLSWETGRMPEIGHIYGGGKVAKLPDYLIVCSRNRLSTDDVEKRTIHVKFLKTRFESSYEGHIFKLLFDPLHGKLNEVY